MQHIQQTATIYVDTSPDVALPLFTAAGERLWVEGWNPEYVYPESGEACVGAIFKTQHTSSALTKMDAPPESIWVNITYDPINHIAAYISVTPNVAVVRVDIRCQATDDNDTAAEIRYSVTALSEHGQQSLESMTETRYQAWMQEWERAINYYLEHGKPIFEPNLA